MLISKIVVRIRISILAIVYYNELMKAISIKLPDPLFHDLAQRAKASASSQSEIIRSALAAYLHSLRASTPLFEAPASPAPQP